MSAHLFLLGKLAGIEDFLLAPETGASAERTIAGRCAWASLLSEVLPRALLAELGFAKALLGTSGGGQFLVVLPPEARPQAEELLTAAQTEAATVSGGRLRLYWAFTENLGDWSLVRKRLWDELRAKQNAPWAGGPNSAAPSAVDDEYLVGLAATLREAETVGWSPESPGRVQIGGGKHVFTVGDGQDAVPVARHVALADDGATPATLDQLADRAEGAHQWGVLRGDVDSFGGRLQKAQTVEEHIQLSVLMKQFLTGELEVLGSLPEFWRRVSILYSGGDDFAVYGSWDALLLMARELQRLFHRFADEQLKDLPGREGKTISMALVLAPETGSPFRFVYEEAGRLLGVAKSADKDAFHVFGRVIDWKQLNRSAELKSIMLRFVREYGCSPEFLDDLSAFFRDRLASPGRERTDRPWRYHRRISLALGSPARRGVEQEFEKQRNALISELIGRGSAQGRLRPSGRVAVDWTRLELGAV